MGSNGADWLLSFAVREEAEFFRPSPAHNFETIVTGIGRRNAADAVHRALAIHHPRRVITAGFAGGLAPGLERGTVVFEADAKLGLDTTLISMGGVAVRFHCAQRVAITAVEKNTLRNETGADAVEMESSAIRALCRDAGIPSATIRVISDAADEDLPLDFNALMTSADRINWLKFAGTIARRPGLILRLIEFRRQTREAAKKLAHALEKIVHDRASCHVRATDS